MRLIRATNEEDMVANFLKTEIGSTRFGSNILVLLERDGVNRRVVDQPNLSSSQDNHYRLRLLGDFRGYRQNRGFFSGFPEEVLWYRMAIGREELLRVKYIRWSYWIRLSSGTRLPTQAALNIRAGMEVTSPSTQEFLSLAERIQQGATFPELILVGTQPDSDLILLEGHVRLTAYALVPDCIPEELDVIVGYSPNLVQWEFY